MDLKNLLVILFILLSLNLSGFINIKGFVSDINTNLPVEYATIYINGSTKGTISDTSGFFQIEKVELPSMLIISHIGYETKVVHLQNKNQVTFNLQLIPKEVYIKEVEVTDNNMREENLTLFKKLFLGDDVWGKYAEIENDDVITFSKNYETVHMIIEDKKLPWFAKYAIDFNCNEDSTLISYQKAVNFYANALAPLKIKIPLLGYNLYVDLAYFNLVYPNNNQTGECSFLGHYYFQPTKTESKKDSIRINKNRQKAHYNSAQHFLKSLYDKKLKENGYLILKNDTLYLEKEKRMEIDATDFLNYKDNYAEITGQKDNSITVVYYQKSEGKPKNITKLDGNKPVVSRIKFMKDTCTIRSNGTIPDISIMLYGFFESKKVGAMLPGDYTPSN